MKKHRIIVKCVVNYGSEYLLLQKWYDDRIENPYQWEFAEGEVEFGEAPERAAERIVAEATGLTAEAAKPLYTWHYMLGDTSNIGICYLLYAHETATVISEEYSDVVWISRLEFADYIKNTMLLNDIERAEL